jgi:hypothetical protein
VPLTDPDALLDMVDAHVKATRRAARRIANAGVDRLERSVRRRTPIDTNPYRHRPERPRGAAKASLRHKPGVELVVRGGRESYRGEVSSDDPVILLLEKDQAPREIRAKAPGGLLHFQSRHGFTDRVGVFHPPGTWVSIEVVHWPGSKGTHALSLGALQTEREIDEYARDPLARWKHEVESVRK